MNKIFSDTKHENQFNELAALNKKLLENTEYLVAGYLLSSMEKTFAYAKSNIDSKGINFANIDKWGFCRGESTLIQFACNFFNGDAYLVGNANITDLVNLDDELRRVVINGLFIYLQNICHSEIECIPSKWYR